MEYYDFNGFDSIETNGGNYYTDSDKGESLASTQSTNNMHNYARINLNKFSSKVLIDNPRNTFLDNLLITDQNTATSSWDTHPHGNVSLNKADVEIDHLMREVEMNFRRQKADLENERRLRLYMTTEGSGRGGGSGGSGLKDPTFPTESNIKFGGGRGGSGKRGTGKNSISGRMGKSNHSGAFGSKRAKEEKDDENGFKGKLQELVRKQKQSERGKGNRGLLEKAKRVAEGSDDVKGLSGYIASLKTGQKEDGSGQADNNKSQRKNKKSSYESSQKSSKTNKKVKRNDRKSREKSAKQKGQTEVSKKAAASDHSHHHHPSTSSQHHSHSQEEKEKERKYKQIHKLPTSQFKDECM